MSRYRKIDVRIWNDAKVRGLSKPKPNARDLWFYLLTNQYTTSIPGLYHAFPETLARGLEWPTEPFLERFEELSKKGMAMADWDAGLVYIPNGIKYDPPANPNVVKGWASAWDELPECDLKVFAFNELSVALEPLDKRLLEAFRDGCGNRIPNGMANQDQEQEQEQEQEKTLAPPPAPRAHFDFESIYARYPRKKSMAKGKTRLEAAVTTQAEFDAVSRGLDRFLEEEKRKGTAPQFMPHFATWVNQRRWEDEDDPANVPGRQRELPGYARLPKPPRPAVPLHESGERDTSK